jgi:hypothetical protein
VVASEQSAVSRYLFCAIHASFERDTYSVMDLTNGVNSLLRAEGGRLLGPRELGSVLSSLGFTRRKRTNVGWIQLIDRKTRVQIHELINSYGVDNSAYLPTKQARDQCDLCKAETWPESKKQFINSTGQKVNNRRTAKVEK